MITKDYYYFTSKEKFINLMENIFIQYSKNNNEYDHDSLILAVLI